MKKNEISAFADKKTSLEKITGGYYWMQSSSNGGQSWNDQRLVTQKGELTEYGETYSYDVYDSDYLPSNTITYGQ